MELISIQSFILLILAILTVRFLPSKAKDAGLALLTLYVIYANNTFANFLITLVIFAAVYGAGLAIGAGKRSRLICRITVICLAAGLILWKYSDFIVWNINRITMLAVKKEVLHETGITAPFGISYGFLTLIAYILGVYWELLEPKKNIFTFTHTVAFFPLWFMGPILGVDDMKNTEELKVTAQSFRAGAWRILWGVFKKLVIAGRCAVIVGTIYGDTDQYGGMYILIGTFAFVLQLYTEFSGAMDIVIGAARILGKTLPENFDRPFASVTVAEFWRRWHITLGAWLKNFILYPILKSGAFQSYGAKLKKRVGKKASRKIVTYTGLLVSWFLIGLWHGGGWNYIFGVGIYFWILIVAGELTEPLFAKLRALLHINRENRCYRVFAHVRTAFLFSVGMLFFRAGSMAAAWQTIKAAFRAFELSILYDGSLLKLGLGAADLVVLGAGTLLLYAVSRLEKKEPAWTWLAGRGRAMRWGITYALIFGILIFGYYGIGFDASSFVYQGF